MRLAWIVQPFCQPLNDPAALHHLAHKHRPRVAGQAFDASLDYHASVEARMEGRWRFTHGLFGSRSHRNTNALNSNAARARARSERRQHEYRGVIAHAHRE